MVSRDEVAAALARLGSPNTHRLITLNPQRNASADTAAPVHSAGRSGAPENEMIPFAASAWGR
jgi:hypothetical protein